MINKIGVNCNRVYNLKGSSKAVNSSNSPVNEWSLKIQSGIEKTFSYSQQTTGVKTNTIRMQNLRVINMASTWNSVKKQYEINGDCWDYDRYIDYQGTVKVFKDDNIKGEFKKSFIEFADTRAENIICWETKHGDKTTIVNCKLIHKRNDDLYLEEKFDFTASKNGNKMIITGNGDNNTNITISRNDKTTRITGVFRGGNMDFFMHITEGTPSLSEKERLNGELHFLFFGFYIGNQNIA